MKGKDIVEKVRKIFNLDKSDRYGFAIYVGFNENIKKRDFMMILQNPGSPGKKEEKEIKNSTNDKKALDLNIKYMKEWIERKNNWFWSGNKERSSSGFIEILRKLLDVEELNKQEILNYVYLTDIVKKRGETEEIDKIIKEKGKKERKQKAESHKLIKKEIKIVKPKLIFVIGTRAWESIKEIYGLEPKQSCKKEEKVTKAHGYLFKIKNGPYVIPLAHFSGRNNYLRESYLDYLEEGVNKYNAIEVDEKK